MKHIAGSLLLVLGTTQARSATAQSPEADPEVVQLVEHFVELVGELRLYALESYLTKDANVIVSKSTRAGFANRVLPAEEWLGELTRGLVPIPFREKLSNLDASVTDGELAVVRCDFEITRNDRRISSGVNFFTVIRIENRWRIASIAYTSIPE